MKTRTTILILAIVISFSVSTPAAFAQDSTRDLEVFILDPPGPRDIGDVSVIGEPQDCEFFYGENEFGQRVLFLRCEDVFPEP